jgi:hypothetical protein
VDIKGVPAKSAAVHNRSSKVSKSTEIEKKEGAERRTIHEDRIAPPFVDWKAVVGQFGQLERKENRQYGQYSTYSYPRYQSVYRLHDRE